MRERRTSVRHSLKWKATINGNDSNGARFGEEGVIENLSATGAFFYISRTVDIGSKVDLAIRLPFKKDNWMQYTAEVVRTELSTSGMGVGIRFDSVKPTFRKV